MTERIHELWPLFASKQSTSRMNKLCQFLTLHFIGCGTPLIHEKPGRLKENVLGFELFKHRVLNSSSSQRLLEQTSWSQFN